MESSKRCQKVIRSKFKKVKVTSVTLFALRSTKCTNRLLLKSSYPLTTNVSKDTLLVKVLYSFNANAGNTAKYLRKEKIKYLSASPSTKKKRSVRGKIYVHVVVIKLKF